MYFFKIAVQHIGAPERLSTLLINVYPINNIFVGIRPFIGIGRGLSVVARSAGKTQFQICRLRVRDLLGSFPQLLIGVVLSSHSYPYVWKSIQKPLASLLITLLFTCIVSVYPFSLPSDVGHAKVLPYAHVPGP